MRMRLQHIIFVFSFTFLSVGIMAQPDGLDYIPTNSSGTFYGQVTVNGSPANSEDWIAAFDEGGTCAGAVQIIINEGIAYANLVIYGDDGTSETVDEGISGGEGFQLFLWRADYSDLTPYPDLENPILFSEWSNTNGAPMPAYNDINVIYDFSAESSVLFDGPGTLCIEGGVTELNGIPSGGVYSGDGVSGDLFDPQVAGEGSHILSYSVNGVTVNATVVVTNTLDATIITSGSFCSNEGTIDLEAATSGGVWTGDGVNGMTLELSWLSPGTYNLEYEITNGTCSSNDMISYTIFPSPSSPLLTYNDNIITASGTEGLNTLWFFEGVELTDCANLEFCVPNEIGNYTIEVVNEYNCLASASIEITTIEISESHLKEPNWTWIGPWTLEFESIRDFSANLWNYSGQLVWSESNHANTLSLSEQPRGLYILVIETEMNICKITFIR